MQDFDRDKFIYWQERTRSQRQSGTSIRAYCQQSGISKDAFFCWRKKLGTGARSREQALFATRSNRSGFLPVQIERSKNENNRESQEFYKDPKWLGGLFVRRVFQSNFDSISISI